MDASSSDDCATAFVEAPPTRSPATRTLTISSADRHDEREEERGHAKEKNVIAVVGCCWKVSGRTVFNR
jgi:hypothetical protein